MTTHAKAAANDQRGPEAIACRRMADPPLTIPRIGKGQRIRRTYMLRLRVGNPSKRACAAVCFLPAYSPG